MTMSASQVDRLGERLRTAPLTEEDRALLLEFRASFFPAYQEVFGKVRGELHIVPSGRPEKTPDSIIAKLRRSRTRLSRMQDIAGCRIVVGDRWAQAHVAERLGALFPDGRVRPTDPKRSHGYRAVHVVVEAHGRVIEIQVRTTLQHLWAMAVERLVDMYGVDFKHGSDARIDGEFVLRRLKRASDGLDEIERTDDRDQVSRMTMQTLDALRARQFAGVMARVRYPGEIEL